MKSKIGLMAAVMMIAGMNSAVADSKPIREAMKPKYTPRKRTGNNPHQGKQEIARRLRRITKGGAE
jgi:hypothetical protein